MNTNGVSIINVTIPVARHLFKSQRLKPSQLAQYCYNIAKQTQSQFNVFSCLYPWDEILAASTDSDNRHKNGTPKGVLDGIPISIKSNIGVKGKPWNASSDILNDVIGYDSVVVQKLKDNGAILIGSTNMDEFGMGSLGNNCNTGRTINPIPYMAQMSVSVNHNRHSHSHSHSHSHDVTHLDYHDPKFIIETLLQRITSLTLPTFKQDEEQQILLSPGGSSSGSAVSVAVGSSLASIGTDTGGSIRLPAGWCGMVGLKPTYGSISRHGVISYASSLDTVGIIANSVECTGLVFDVLKNNIHESVDQIGDSTSCFVVGTVDNVDKVDTGTTQHLKPKSLDGLRVGIPEAFVLKECPPHILQAWESIIQLLEENNATIVTITDDQISNSTVKMSLPAYYVISSAEASSNLARYDGLKFGKLDEMQDKRFDNTTLAPIEQCIATTRAFGFGKEVKRRVLAGSAVLSSDRFHSYYEAATKVRAAIVTEFENVFNETSQHQDGVDLIVIPTAFMDPKIYESTSSSGNVDNTEAFQNDVLTTPISLAGLPSISIPVWTNNCGIEVGAQYQHPVVGIQIIGNKGSDQTVLSTSNILLSLVSRNKPFHDL